MVHTLFLLCFNENDCVFGPLIKYGLKPTEQILKKEPRAFYYKSS